MDKTRTFHPFSRLPQELQLIIWEYVVANIKSRRRKLKYLYLPGLPNSNVRKHDCFLHLCHGSRITYLKYYKAWGAYRTGSSDGRTTQKFSYGYVNFEKDTFAFSLDFSDLDRSKKRVVISTYHNLPGQVYTLANDQCTMPSCHQGTHAHSHWFYSIEGNGVGRIRTAVIKQARSHHEHLSRPRGSAFSKHYRSEIPVTEEAFLEKLIKSGR